MSIFTFKHLITKTSKKIAVEQSLKNKKTTTNMKELTSQSSIVYEKIYVSWCPFSLLSTSLQKKHTKSRSCALIHNKNLCKIEQVQPACQEIYKAAVTTLTSKLIRSIIADIKEAITAQNCWETAFSIGVTQTAELPFLTQIQIWKQKTNQQKTTNNGQTDVVKLKLVTSYSPHLNLERTWTEWCSDNSVLYILASTEVTWNRFRQWYAWWIQRKQV